MARTVIPVTVVPSHARGANLTPTVGDPTNEHSLYTGSGKKTILIVANYHVASVTFQIQMPASKFTLFETFTKTITVPAAVGSVAGKVAVVFDVPPITQADGNVYIDSADANFTNARLYAYTWQSSRG